MPGAHRREGRAARSPPRLARPLVLRFRSPSRGRRGRFKRRCARLGEFDQIVRSDMTFAGAIQEQLQDAGHNGLAFNEANFAVVKGMYPSHASS